ncbi:MAG: DUF488 domain-containing protein [Actinobacteria bacterium]|nr:DUF488 domain-containing protein [Actinomycetota bacterium]
MLVTVGHGTLAASEFLALLGDASVAELVDVRSHPGSRRVPHFSREAMRVWVPAGGIADRWEPALGGRRRPHGPSRNVALRNESFRAYADHMASQEFRDALAALTADAREQTVAIMCAESVWWRCHRRLIADAAVLLHGTDVRDLFHDGRLVAHEPAREARVTKVDGEELVVYDVGVDHPLFDSGAPGGGEGRP